MTEKSPHSPLDACLADPNLARGAYDCGPGIVRQGYTVLGALSAHLCFRLARDQHGFDPGGRLGVLEIVDVARNLAVEEIGGIDDPGIDVDGKHAVGEAPVRPRGAGSGQRAAEQFADQRQTRALVLTERTDRALPLAVVARPLGFVRSVE